jgi:hypothetical protein
MNLKSVKDSNAIILEETAFETKTFFTKLHRLKNSLGWPVEVFAGCKYIKMNVTNENGNTYLFHTNTPTD